MNKFGDLPGIDYNSQEVFESSDVEVDDPVVNALEGDTSPATSVSQLQDQFAEIEIASGRCDLPNNFPSQTMLYLDRRKETKQDKLARIRRELEEIQQEEETDIPEADELLQIFNALNTTSSKQKFPTEEELKINEILIPPSEPIKATSQQVATVVTLETKLSQLEKQLGIDNSLPHSVQHSLNDITRQLNIINHADFNLDSIKSKIESTGKEMEKLELNKRLFGWEDVPTPKEDKVDEIYEILPDLKKYCATAPSILERIKGLSKIHNEVEESLHFSINLNQFISDLELEMQEWDKALESLNRGLDKLNETFDTNRKSLEKRLEELEKRVTGGQPLMDKK